MKKFVFISLILALVAAVAFAQDEGSWSVSGSGQIGTMWNFRNRNDAGNHVKPTVSPSGYNMYGYYDAQPYATLGLTYSKGSLSTGLSWNLADDVYADLSFNDDTAAFQANVNVSSIFPSITYDKIGRLWGYYKFLDGKIHLEAAVTSRDTNWWYSNRVLGNVFDDTKLVIEGGSAVTGDGFIKVDHHTYLLANFAPIEGLEVGFMLPGMFPNELHADAWAGVGAITGSGLYGKINDSGTPPGHHDVQNGLRYDYLSAVFKNAKLGAKYATGPVEVALQFALLGNAFIESVEVTPGDWQDVFSKDKLTAGLYLGGKYNISDGINAGLAMEATFNGEESQYNTFGIGLSFGYGAGALNASLEAGLQWRNNAKDKDFKDKGLFGLKPYVAYNIVENYLCLSLGALLYFDLNEDFDKYYGIGYEITPELWFNIAGTGAGAGYYYPNGGPAIILRYKVGGYTKQLDMSEDPATDPHFNAFDITFKWAF